MHHFNDSDSYGVGVWEIFNIHKTSKCVNDFFFSKSKQHHAINMPYDHVVSDHITNHGTSGVLPDFILRYNDIDILCEFTMIHSKGKK